MTCDDAVEYTRSYGIRVHGGETLRNIRLLLLHYFSDGVLVRLYCTSDRDTVEREIGKSFKPNKKYMNTLRDVIIL